MRQNMRSAKDHQPKCKLCADNIGDDGSFECDLCGALLCIGCSSIPQEVYDFISANEHDIPVICTHCKAEIPTLREIKGIKNLQVETEKEITRLKEENTEIRDTMRLQGEQLAEILTKLNNPSVNAPYTAAVLANPQAKTELSSIVRSEMSERAEIDKLKMNLVVSGIEETNSDDTDKAAAKALLEEELDITLDLASTERIGKPGDEPRLLRLKFITQRSRKELLTKNLNLRNSAHENVKRNVYVRPDLTKRQQLESKNLREQLRKTRDDNPGQTYKIHRNKIMCTSRPAEQVLPEQPQD